jgi:hypothetical protein
VLHNPLNAVGAHDNAMRRTKLRDDVVIDVIRAREAQRHLYRRPG